MTSGYSVIEIIDNTTIMIDYGSDQGAEEKEVIRIIELGSDVIHPSTHENLGEFYTIKDVLKISTVYQNFSLCRKLESKLKPIFPSFGELTYNSTVIITLNVDEDKMTHRELTTSKPIFVGDPIIIE